MTNECIHHAFCSSSCKGLTIELKGHPLDSQKCHCMECKRINNGHPILWLGYFSENVKIESQHGAYVINHSKKGAHICCSICNQVTHKFTNECEDKCYIHSERMQEPINLSDIQHSDLNAHIYTTDSVADSLYPSGWKKCSKSFRESQLDDDMYAFELQVELTLEALQVSTQRISGVDPCPKILRTICEFAGTYLNISKIASVIVCSKDRNAQTALNEAWDLEKAFIHAGYDLFFYGGRHGIHESPISACKKHFDEVSDYINVHREHLDGAFIFIMSHGYTDLREGDLRPLICTENDDVDVFDYMERLLDTEFPMVFGINACRILPRSSLRDFNIDRWKEFGSNLFVSWGASKGKKSFEGRFVELWRKTLVDPKFKQEPITDLAATIKRDLAAFGFGGGIYHNGFDSEWKCIGGVFVQPDRPSNTLDYTNKFTPRIGLDQCVTVENAGRKFLQACKDGDLELMREAFDITKNWNVSDKYGNTAAHLVCECNNVECIKFLHLTCGASFDIKNASGQVPLITCVLRNYKSCLEYMLSEMMCDANITDSQGKHALIHASSRGHVDFVKALCGCFPPSQANLQDKKNLTALSYASKRGCIDILKILLEASDCFPDLGIATEIALSAQHLECAELLEQNGSNYSWMTSIFHWSKNVVNSFLVAEAIDPIVQSNQYNVELRDCGVGSLYLKFYGETKHLIELCKYFQFHGLQIGDEELILHSQMVAICTAKAFRDNVGDVILSFLTTVAANDARKEVGTVENKSVTVDLNRNEALNTSNGPIHQNRNKRNHIMKAVNQLKLVKVKDFGPSNTHIDPVLLHSLEQLTFENQYLLTMCRILENENYKISQQDINSLAEDCISMADAYSEEDPFEDVPDTDSDESDEVVEIQKVAEPKKMPEPAPSNMQKASNDGMDRVQPEKKEEAEEEVEALVDFKSVEDSSEDEIDAASPEGGGELVEGLVKTAAESTTGQNQSKADGKGKSGKYDLWSDAPFPGLFYTTKDFKKLCDKRSNQLGKKVDIKTGIPKGGKSVKVDRATNAPKNAKTGSNWAKAASNIVRGKKFKNPATGKIFSGNGIC